MRKYTVMVGLILVLFITSCAAPAPPAQPGTPVTHATACNEENNNKRVSLEGYPRLSDLVYVSDDFSVDFFEQPDGGGETVSVYLTVGTGANQAEDLPDDFSDEDLRIHTNTNEVVSTGARIRVHGTLSSTRGADGNVVCFINAIDLIEEAPAAQ